jgi:predicted nucleic acid-binding protein
MVSQADQDVRYLRGAQPAGATGGETRPPVPAVVLDTNTVLALWWFQDPALGALDAALQAGRLRWCLCERMRDEAMAVMARLEGAHDRRPATDGMPEPALRSARTLQQMARLAHLCVNPPRAQTLTCRDASDQVFLDLALSLAAPWLLSRDRDLLAMRRRAARYALAIGKPEEWRGPPTAV